LDKEVPAANKHQIDPSESADEHFTRRFCQHIIEQHDVLELFGCDIPRELQRHQLSVAYVSLNLSPESEEESSETVEVVSAGAVGRRGDQLEGQEKLEEEFGDASGGLEYVLDDIGEKTGRLMIRGPAGAGKSTLLRWCAIYAAQQVPSGPAIPAKASR
jgi:hypothetical protein